MTPNGSAGEGRTPAASPPDLVIVGAASRDIDPADPRGWRLGGAVSYGSILAARLGVRVGVLMGLDAPARRATELELIDADHATVVPVPLERGPVFDNVETELGRRQVCHQVSDRLPVTTLPAAWRSAPAFLLAPVAGELGPEWAGAVPPRALVGLSWQGLLRELRPGREVVHLPAHPDPLVARADLVGVSREDLRAGGDALAELLPRDGQEMAITAGERGSLHVRRDAGRFRFRCVPAVPTTGEVDPVGAGDAYLTTWLVARMPGGPFGAAPLSTPRALHLAAVVACLAIEGVGLRGLPDAGSLARRLYESRTSSASPGG